MADPAPRRPSSSALDSDPEYRSAVIDLLGVLAYGELMAFERLAADAALAPTIEDEAQLAAMASAEHRHFTRLRDRIAEMGVDPWSAMTPFRAPLEQFHAMTAPSDWLEGLVKAYVGDGFGTDFYREISAYLDPQTSDLVMEVCSDLGQSAFVVDRVRAAIAADPRVEGRLALWARRLVGEALSQAQRVAAERDALSGLFIGEATDLDLTGIGQMLGRLTDEHTKRMQALGLSS